MNIFARLEVFKEYEFVTYYTVRLIQDEEPDELNETDKFYEKHNDDQHSHFPEYLVLMKIIDAIGYHFKGAEARLFRFGDDAGSLPSYKTDAKNVFGIEVKNDSELRLYCVRLTNEIVILLNGGVKTTDKILDCPNVSPHFKFAKRIASAIDALQRAGDVSYDGQEIVNHTGDTEINFYN